MIRWVMVVAAYTCYIGGLYAAGVTYIATLNTSALVGHPAGPFSLAFQFTDGSVVGDANNTVTLSGFNFGGGGAIGVANTLGGATGSLSSTVTLTDSLFLNYLIQRFNPGQSLSFQVTATNNVDSGGTPDQFSFSILDNTGQELPTQAGVPFFNPFLTVTMNSSNPTLQTFASDPTRPPAGGGPPITIGAPLVIPRFSDGVYQLRYLANLNQGDSFINLTNAGTLNGFDPAGRICVNVYTFDPAEEMISCCACSVTPNGLNSLSARNDLIGNTLTPGVPTSITVKLLSSLPLPGNTCNASSPNVANLVRGMRAWATTLHLNTSGSPAVGYQETETPFSTAELSDTELSKLTGFCGFIQANGSGFGICKSCRAGGLGATQK